MRVRGVSLAPHPRLACPMGEDILRLSGPGPPPTSKPSSAGARSSCSWLPWWEVSPAHPSSGRERSPWSGACGASECPQLLSDSSLPSLGQAERGARGVRPASIGLPAGPNPLPSGDPAQSLPKRSGSLPGRGACSSPPPGPGRGCWGRRGGWG